MTTYIKVKLFVHGEGTIMDFGKVYEVKASNSFILKNMNNSKPAQLMVYIHKRR